MSHNEIVFDRALLGVLVFLKLTLALLFLVMARLMATRTDVRTRLGSALVRLFAAVGVLFVVIGTIYAATLADATTAWDYDRNTRWVLRSLLALVALWTIAAATTLLPSLVDLVRHELVRAEHVVKLTDAVERQTAAVERQEVATERLEGVTEIVVEAVPEVVKRASEEPHAS